MALLFGWHEFSSLPYFSPFAFLIWGSCLALGFRSGSFTCLVSIDLISRHGVLEFSTALFVLLGVCLDVSCLLFLGSLAGLV